SCIKNLSIEWEDCSGCGPLRLDEASWWRATIVLVISLLAVPTNLLVIVVVKQTPALHNNQCIYMVALAISDLSAGLCFLCTSFRYAVTGYGPRSWVELELGAWMYYLALTTGLILTVSIGLDKLHQINWPYSYDRVMSRRKVIGIVLGIWLGIAVLSCLPTRIVPISGYYYEFTSSTLMFNTRACKGENEPDMSLLIVRISLFLFLILVLFGGYGTILVITRRHVRRMRSMQHCSVPLAPTSSKEDGQAQESALDTAETKARTASSETESAQFVIAWFAIIYTSLNAVIYGGTYRPFKNGLARSSLSGDRVHWLRSGPPEPDAAKSADALCCCCCNCNWPLATGSQASQIRVTPPPQSSVDSEQAPQTTRPHQRQWCLRWNMENLSRSQHMHLLAAESGVHAARGTA
uniref:G_PROTEIN_RECEP_F1_2 domain-containing protein n=1 Tax=Macrostomum lignano TaxID=282301 RepID=A0A1I8IU02_9PLAT